MIARWLPFALLVGAWGILPDGVTAGGHHGAACDTCVAVPCETTIHKTDVVLMEKQEATVLPEINLREVATRVPTINVSVEYKEEKRCVTIVVAKPREVERVVQSVTCVPEVTCDPCTGCSCITYKQVPQCRTEKVTVYDHCEETREVVVKVPVLKTAPGEVVVNQLTADWTSRPAVATRLDAVVVPTEITIPRVGCPLPPPPSCPCH